MLEVKERFLYFMVSVAMHSFFVESQTITELARMNITEIIASHGYPVEQYRVTTVDGYILSLFRIPYGSKQHAGRRSTKTPVLFQHGLLNSATDWIITGPSKSLVYMSVEAGYDVWLGNARGNTYSRRHVRYSPDDSRFWQFSWDEIGRYDVPAFIDLILTTTGHDRLHYVGFSQGTTSFYVMASLRPEYNAKIRAMIALAPIAFMSRIKSPLMQLFAGMEVALNPLLESFSLDEFLPSNDVFRNSASIFCKEGSVTQPICSNLLFLLCGFSSKQFNTTLLPAIIGHFPAGAATRQLWHYAQEINSGKFRRYDFGFKTNRRVYGTFVPPVYDLSKVTAPVSLHYSDNDWMAHPDDVRLLERALPNVVGSFRVPNDEFNHLDFLWAIDAPLLLYRKVMRVMAWY